MQHGSFSELRYHPPDMSSHAPGSAWDKYGSRWAAGCYPSMEDGWMAQRHLWLSLLSRLRVCLDIQATSELRKKALGSIIPRRDAKLQLRAGCYGLPFTSLPRCCNDSCRERANSGRGKNAEINNLLNKRAIRVVTTSEAHKPECSSYFTVPKNGGVALLSSTCDCYYDYYDFTASGCKYSALSGQSSSRSTSQTLTFLQ